MMSEQLSLPLSADRITVLKNEVRLLHKELWRRGFLQMDWYQCQTPFPRQFHEVAVYPPKYMSRIPRGVICGVGHRIVACMYDVLKFKPIQESPIPLQEGEEDLILYIWEHLIDQNGGMDMAKFRSIYRGDWITNMVQNTRNGEKGQWTYKI